MPTTHHLLLSTQPPFADKVYTNYVPSDAEIDEIRTLLAEPLDELARLDCKIREIQAVLHYLKIKHRLLKDGIDNHKALISPMRRLPQEILQEIFLACLPNDRNASFGPVDAPRDAPLLLSVICRYWRMVAHAMPRLWSGLHLSCLPTRGGNPKFTELVDAWLKRAGTCPLSISLSHDADLGQRHDVVKPIFDASRRIQHLQITANAHVPPVFRPFLALGAEHLPILKSLTLQIRGTFHVIPKNLNILQNPSLRHISLVVSADPLTLPIPWTQLTELAINWVSYGSIGGIHLNGALALLSACENLVRCSLSIPDSRGFTTRPIFTLPRLQNLTLTFFNKFPNPVDFMECLSLPNLRHLVMSHGEQEDQPRGSKFPLPGTHDLLIDLSLQNFTQTSLFSFFTLVPRLTLLRLWGGNQQTLDELFLPRLTPTPEQPSRHLCPSLTHFEATGQASSAFSDVAVLGFLRGRFIHGPPLKQVRISFDRSMEVDILPELKPLVSEGLVVNLIYPRLSMFGNHIGSPLSLLNM
ncbi:hypothetical protein C8R44DRAFT_772740 [Mycena epipterygia]|nr:hypothetical protein C8R44DRAFT_772740 [Mycena epipterygia]